MSKPEINMCGDCPHWHEAEYVENPWGYSPWCDCDMMPEERNPLIEYDKPMDCPMEREI